MLPDVVAVRLEEIHIQAPRPAPPTEAALIERLAARARDAARYEARAGLIEAGDELVVDLVLAAEDKLVSGGSLEGVRLWAGHPVLGAVHAALVGREVGEAFALRIRFDDDHVTLAGTRATARGRVRAAFAVTPPDLEDRAQLASLGYGDDMRVVMRAITDELEAEAEADVAGQIRERVFDALLERVPVEVDRAWVDAGLEAAFDARERALLEAVAPERLEEARASWLADGFARDLEERKVKVTLVLRALCERDGVVLTKEAVDFAIDRVAEMMDVGRDEVDELVKTEPEVDAQVTNLAMQVVAISHVLEAVRVKDAPKRFSVLGARMTTLMD